VTTTEVGSTCKAVLCVSKFILSVDVGNPGGVTSVYSIIVFLPVWARSLYALDVFQGSLSKDGLPR